MTRRDIDAPTDASPLDLAGVGIGPFNLSLAALLAETGIARARFFDARPAFDWHPGMLLPGVTLQSSFLRDLVTPVMPESRFSFLRYLVDERKFFAFLNAGFAAIPRSEMTGYFQWAAARVPALEWDAAIEEIDHDGESFRLRGPRADRRARNICIGTGSRPWVPEWAAPRLSETMFHCAGVRDRLPGLAGKRVAVIGGGQSGAEAVERMLSGPVGEAGAPASILWLSRRHNFEPINETPFSNQVYSPEYGAAYRTLAGERQARALERSILTSDGISLSTLDTIYREIYRIRHGGGEGPEAALLPGRSVAQVEKRGESWRLTARNAFDGGVERWEADAVILATGFRFALPEALAPLSRRIARDAAGGPIPGDDYALNWDGPADAKIFAMNAGRRSHGIADSQLSLTAWRSARIVNALAGREVFDLTPPRPVVDWASVPGAVAALERMEA